MKEMPLSDENEDEIEEVDSESYREIIEPK
jgi:hypothetical protein